jgi:hypothetical protein
MICHATPIVSLLSTRMRHKRQQGKLRTYFLPRQSLEPTENG